MFLFFVFSSERAAVLVFSFFPANATEKDARQKQKPPPSFTRTNQQTNNSIPNPKYKGLWEAPDVDNPDYKPDPSLYAQKDLKYVGFELWQVKSGSIFDNIFVSDDFDAAMAFADETWGASKDAEKEAFEAAKKKEDEEKKAAGGGSEDEYDTEGDGKKEEGEKAKEAEVEKDEL